VRRVAFAALAVLLVARAEASGPQSWERDLTRSLESIKSENYAESLKLTRRVLSAMESVLGPGEQSTRAMGIVVLHKAVAHAGLGQDEEALWYWNVARAFYPLVATGKLEPFGPHAERLRALAQGRDSGQSAMSVAGETAAVTAPRIKKRVQPNYPPGAQAFGEQGLLILQLVIGADGVVRSPSILKPLGAPTLTYAAMEAVKRWTFEPGMKDGKPVPVIFKLTMEYKLK
jgi:TonB family protein